MTKIKMCGLFRIEDVKAANELLPDYAGFVFAKKGHRFIDEEQAIELRKLLSPKIQTVGVFINERPERIAYLLKRGIIDVAQLHGSETKEDIYTLRQMTEKPIWKVFSTSRPDAVKEANESPADLVVLDSGSGGTGETFDWSILKDMKRPYFLAGGLTSENVTEAMERLDLYGVDVSSGIETDRKKDPDKMRRFAEAVRGCPERK